jgi:hypothetical protein
LKIILFITILEVILSIIFNKNKIIYLFKKIYKHSINNKIIRSTPWNATRERMIPGKYLLLKKNSKYYNFTVNSEGFRGNEFKKNGYDIPYKIYSRRDGDIEKIWADIEKSKNVLGWTPIYTISDSIKSIITSIENNVDK